jgi:hypothetical protein
VVDGLPTFERGIVIKFKFPKRWPNLYALMDHVTPLQRLGRFRLRPYHTAGTLTSIQRDLSAH